MKAAVFAGPGDLQLRDVPDPIAGDDGLVLRVGANTVCGTDGRILRGEKTAGIDVGTILGHEIGGYVVEVGKNVTGFAEGDLVAVNPTIPCGRCFYCKRGVEHLCNHARLFGYAVDGGLAEYVRIPSEALIRGGVYKAAAHLEPVEAALSEPLGCVINGSRSYDAHLGDTVVIMGAGPIGLLHTQLVRHLGASRVIISDPSEPRRELALTLGATHAVDPTKLDLETYVRDLTNGIGADLTILCIGHPALLQQAFTLTRKRGHINAFAGFPKGIKAEIDPNLIHYGEFVVTGASNSVREAQETALRLIAEGAINVKALHTHTFSLDRVHEGIEFAASGKGVKVAIVPEAQ